MNSKTATLLVALLGIIALSGCIDQTVTFNRNVCNKFNDNYGSFSGTVCAREVMESDSFTAERAQVGQMGYTEESRSHSEILRNILEVANRNGFLSYSCDPNQLENGVTLAEAGTCNENESCIQNGNQATCIVQQIEPEPEPVPPTLAEILDAWDSRAIPRERINLFCANMQMQGENGSTQTRQADGTFEYEAWTKASFCDSRSGKENSRVEITCTKTSQQNAERTAFNQRITVSYQDCSDTNQNCTVLSDSNAACAGTVNNPSGGNLEPEACETVAGERGITGNAAVPRIRLSQTIFDNPLAAPQDFLEGQQFLAALYYKLNELEPLSQNSSFSAEQFEQAGVFTVRLRKDHFSEQMLKDFAELRNTQLASVPASFQQKWYQYFETPIIHFSPTLVEAGTYQAKLVFEWKEEPYQFFNAQNEPLVQGITVQLEKIAEPTTEEKSPFLDFSLDYDLQQQNPDQPKDYGTYFSGVDNASKPIVLFQKPAPITVGQLTNNAFKKINFAAWESFDGMNFVGNTLAGTVLVLSDRAMFVSFSRANPVGGLVDLSKTNKISYRLQSLEDDYTMGQMSSRAEWTFFASDKSCSAFSPTLPFTATDAKIAGCTRDSTTLAYQLSFDAGSSGKVLAKTVFFISTLPDQSEVLLTACGTDSVFATASNSTANGNSALSLSSENLSVQSMDDIFTQIQNKNICVVQGNGETRYAWNKKAIDGQVLKIEQKIGESGLNRCDSIETASNSGCTNGFICGGLCYTQPYVKCVNETAQTINSNSEEDYASARLKITENDHPVSFEKGSDAQVIFTIVNDSSTEYEVKTGKVDHAAFWAPVAFIDFVSLHLFDQRGDYLEPITESTFVLSPNQQKEVTYRIPTDSVTIAGNLHFAPKFKKIPTNTNYRFVLQRISKPISIFDEPNKKCGNYTYSPDEKTQFAFCLGNTYFPLGPPGCSTDADCQGYQKCVRSSCFPYKTECQQNGCTTAYGNPSNIEMVGTVIYLGSNTEEANQVEEYIKGQFEILSQKWKKDSEAMGLSREKSLFTYQRCNLSRTDMRGILDQTEHINAFDEIIRRCLPVPGATHNYILLVFDSNAGTDTDPLYRAQYEKIFTGFAQGVYLGNGKMYGTMDAGKINDAEPNSLATVMLHELFHSLGAPDLYANLDNNVYGATFLWGNCMLMKADILDLKSMETDLNFDFPDYPLCPLEKYYFGAKP